MYGEGYIRGFCRTRKEEEGLVEFTWFLLCLIDESCRHVHTYNLASPGLFV